MDSDLDTNIVAGGPRVVADRPESSVKLRVSLISSIRTILSRAFSRVTDRILDALWTAVLFLSYLRVIICRGVRSPLSMAQFMVNLSIRQINFWNEGVGVITFPLDKIFRWCNRGLREEMSAREDKCVGALFVILLVVFAVYNTIYIALDMLGWQEYFRYLLILFPDVDDEKWWFGLNIVAIASFNDYNAKYLSVVLKTCLALLPESVLPFPKREFVFYSLEIFFQLYRFLLPVPLWIVYLVGWAFHFPYIISNHNLVGLVATVVYLYVKLKRSSWQAFFKWAETYGFLKQYQRRMRPVEEVIRNCPHCPICFDAFDNPTVLDCNHAFCNFCITKWFFHSGERQCPVCRTNVKWELDYTLFYVLGHTDTRRICY